jgi:hypothetical protein
VYIAIGGAASWGATPPAADFLNGAPPRGDPSGAPPEWGRHAVPPRPPPPLATDSSARVLLISAVSHPREPVPAHMHRRLSNEKGRSRTRRGARLPEKVDADGGL